MSGRDGDKYRVTKKILVNGRRYYPGSVARMNGKDAESLYYAGCVDNQDRRDNKNRPKHELDKRSH